ncbi:hypothetical protein RRG08_025298 [Elysia crispata]|uniref:Uncharacterized protein n=1 Tax=Elysia crispata TaxID=231223 RepID=A0AAE1DUR3_9GAST|nr:hypothetical protein RRG08_025298 [Elysia crispata]
MKPKRSMNMQTYNIHAVLLELSKALIFFNISTSILLLLSFATTWEKCVERLMYMHQATVTSKTIRRRTLIPHVFSVDGQAMRGSSIRHLVFPQCPDYDSKIPGMVALHRVPSLMT